MPRVVLVVASSSYRVRDFLRAACRVGVEVTVASDHAPLFEHAAGHLQIVFSPPGEGVASILEHAAAQPVDAVVASDDRGAVLAARAARALGLAHDDPKVVALAGDKHLMRLALQRAGLPTPWFKRLSLDADLATEAQDVAYPAVVKPLHLCASQGVIRVDDAAGLVAACHRIERILARRTELTARRHRHSVLVESYLPGHEVALEGLLERATLTSLALFDKPGVSRGPYFEETVYVTPSCLPHDLQRAVALQVEAAAAIGLRSGPVHAELRLNGAGIWILELAPRSIGGLCSRSLGFVPDVTLEELILRQALGLALDNYRARDGASGVMMIPIPALGRLHAVHGVNAARAVAGIEDVVISIACGETLVPLPEGDRYLGFIFARSDDRDTVVEALHAAHRCLRFDVSPVAPALEEP